MIILVGGMLSLEGAMTASARYVCVFVCVFKREIVHSRCRFINTANHAVRETASVTHTHTRWYNVIINERLLPLSVSSSAASSYNYFIYSVTL